MVTQDKHYFRLDIDDPTDPPRECGDEGQLCPLCYEKFARSYRYLQRLVQLDRAERSFYNEYGEP